MYNGHKNRNYWNVALWLGNDESLYAMARSSYVDNGRSAQRAAAYMLDWLLDNGMNATPDGERYTLASLSAAIGGMRSCWKGVR